MTGERGLSETYESILASLKEDDKRALQGTLSDMCSVRGCPNVVSLLEDGSVIPKAGYRLYPDGTGEWPTGCSDHPNCLAKNLLQ